MLFTTLQFAVFFPIVVLFYYIVPKQGKQIWLLLASYYFYMGWNPKYALLIAISTFVTYGCGLVLDKVSEQDDAKRKKIAAMVISLLINLGLLAFFKYFYFLHDTLDSILGIFGGGLQQSKLDIVLPVGISFYTFQAIGYTVDVYRGEIKAEKNFVRYALFVSFFPQLVAGPIERSRNLLTQIQEIPAKKMWNYERAVKGLLTMLWGYFLKMVIADRASILVDQVFDVYYMCGGVALLLAVLLFGIQIYCDFASYSAIAIGAAQILGIELMENFKQPFFSKSISEFWRRWHISLSSWLRDYVYISLGGNRCSKIRRYLNIMATFLISGLWHGASWHFVVWGGLQGVFIIISDLMKPLKKTILEKGNVRVQTFGYKVVQVILTNILFFTSVIFFRADSIKDAFYYFDRLIHHFDVWSFFDQSVYELGLEQKEFHVLIVSILILFIVDAFCYIRKSTFAALLRKQCIFVQYVVIVFLWIFIWVFGIYGQGYDAAQFIYFQF